MRPPTPSPCALGSLRSLALAHPPPPVCSRSLRRSQSLILRNSTAIFWRVRAAVGGVAFLASGRGPSHSGRRLAFLQNLAGLGIHASRTTSRREARRTLTRGALPLQLFFGSTEPKKRMVESRAVVAALCFAGANTAAKTHRGAFTCSVICSAEKCPPGCFAPRVTLRRSAVFGLALLGRVIR